MKLWGIILDNGQSIFVKAETAGEATEEWALHVDETHSNMPAVQMVRAIALQAERPQGSTEIYIGPPPMTQPPPGQQMGPPPGPPAPSADSP